jgi:undecaprenyl-phosphate 4-deoxy-4-formamido-L-arabinose transferase
MTIRNQAARSSAQSCAVLVEVERKMSISTRPLKISVVVPIFNEESNVSSLIEKLLAVLSGSGDSFEIVCVDDGSTDRTPSLLREAERHSALKVITLARNFGQHAAILAGFEASTGELVITLDADLQNPPEEIPRIVAEFRKGHDLIGTYRKERQDSAFRRTASWILNRIMRKLSRIELRDYGCMLRGYSGEIAHAIANLREYRTFIPALGTIYASSPIEIPVSHARRATGASKYSLFRLVSLALDLMTCFSLSPLRLLFLCGTAISLLGGVFGLFLLVGRFWLFGPGWAAQGVFTLFAVLFFFVGAQFIAIGVLGEYIGRIFQEVRNRPPYVLKKTSASPVDWRGEPGIPCLAEGGSAEPSGGAKSDPSFSNR